LILAHQYIDQLVQGESTVVKDAVFGNVGTMVSFRIGAADAEFLEKEFEPEFMMNDLVNLGFANVYLKLMIDGMASRPFSANTLAPFLATEKSQRDKIIKVSRERYSSKRAEVENKIAKWSGVIDAEKTEKEKVEKTRNPSPVQQQFEDICWECGKKTYVKFKPDGQRPIYCPDCLKKVRGSKEENPIVISGKRGAVRSDSVRTGELVTKGKSENVISLDEATKKEPTYFSRKERERPKKQVEVNLDELRKTLKDALKKGDNSDSNDAN
jgi:CxxC-x17-CxxC domain-containing protein